MKTERRIAPSSLWLWLQGKLPRGLVPATMIVGYGRFCGIYLNGSTPGFWAREFENIGNPVATISGFTVELHHPQWLSDFEDLLRRFEAEMKVSTKLIYWESP